MRADIRTAIRRGNLPQGYELQTSDIGRGLSIGEGFGVVQKGDVGKRCWSRDYGLVMESDDQRNKRKASTSRSPSHPEGETMPSTAYRYLSIEAPDIGAEIDFLDHVASVKVYLDHTHNPPTLRIEVTAGPSEDAPSSLYQDFEVTLPEREETDEDTGTTTDDEE